MRAHTKTHPIKKVQKNNEQSVSVSVDDLVKTEFPDRSAVGVFFAGLRYRENLTQSELAKKLGTNQANISNMEHGNRPIGKSMAKKIEAVFNIDYRHFL